MDAPANMYYFKMLMLLLVTGVCTFWLGRIIQWLLLRKTHPRKKIFFILLSSIAVSYLLALLVWFFWPQTINPMWGIFFLPAVFGEIIILILTFVLFKKGKHT